MFWLDVVLVFELTAKYGRRAPLLDLGGIDCPTVADYQPIIDNPTAPQESRYVKLSCRPFDLIDPDYRCINPDQKNGQTIEQYAATNPDTCGQFVCLNVLEHVRDPFAVYGGFKRLLKPDGYGIIHTLFSFPHHGDWGKDFWRFTPKALELLAETAGLRNLECARCMNIGAQYGVKNMQNGEPQEIKTVYQVVCRELFVPQPESQPFRLPERFTCK